ncbi:hypothetical protein FRC07_004206 [Ceratobasidium sp. 392]|nr:hypothetical protein FRC07_004206 [Ceratobasidium sp. 392]
MFSNTTSHLTFQEIKIGNGRVKQAEVIRAEQIAAEEARIVQEACRNLDRINQEREINTESPGEFDPPNTDGPYNLRPARARKPLRLFPGMIPSIKPPQKLRAPIDILPGTPQNITMLPRDSAPPVLADSSPDGESTNCSGNPDPSPVLSDTAHRTAPNIFGLLHEYYSNTNLPPLSVAESHASSQTLQNPSAYALPELSAVKEMTYADQIRQIIWPLPNLSVFRFAHWFYTHDNANSQVSGNDLISKVIGSKDFNPKELKGTKIEAINACLDRIDAPVSANSCNADTSSHLPNDGWISPEIKIYLPTGKRSHPGYNPTPLHVPGAAETFGEPFVVPGFRHRRLIEVMKKTFTDPECSRNFQYRAYKKVLLRPDGTEERVFGDLYSSDAWIDEQQQIDTLDIPAEDGLGSCKLERAIAAHMFGSDSAMANSFGQSSIWPLYGYYGNERKWFRRKPSAHASEHLAHFPKLPPNLKDRIASLHGKAARAPLLAHCKRELFHACWAELLDADFLHAYHNGIVVKCGDGVFRRLFPCIFTYSADYPENTAVENILQSDSSVPTLTRLGDLDTSYSMHRMLVPDVMHEFELGVWKSVFVHLIRMVESLGLETVQELNARYRTLGTFGIDTIRKFHHDVSEMKSLAARDFEDILQCSIPCFAGLFPKHDDDIKILLFVLAEWQFLAKLRMHTETTLAALRASTKLLGSQMRHFRDHIAKSYKTKETNKEYRARARRALAKSTKLAQVSSNTTGPVAAPANATSQTVERRPKDFNLHTYKVHALGDLPTAVVQFGTSDSYSTQIIELEHRRAKRQYKHTNKVDAVKQMTQIERREAHLRSRAKELHKLEHPNAQEPAHKARRKSRATDAYNLEIESNTIWGSLTDRYHIAVRGKPNQLGAIIARLGDDPAGKNFYAKLERHLAMRFGVQLPPEYSLDPTLHSLSSFTSRPTIPSFKIYEHAALRINFTTYDIHRAHDTVGPQTLHRFVLVQCADEDLRHPFGYARVLGIYHVDARIGSLGETRRVDLLWVRWLGESKWGSWKQHRLDRISYVDDGDANGAFDFIDPSLVVRGVYLAPAFHLGRTKSFLRQSLAWDSPDEGDWAAYYVIRFVDRDMGMRYLGGGIGHLRPDPPLDEEPTDTIEGLTGEELPPEADDAGPDLLAHDDLNTGNLENEATDVSDVDEDDSDMNEDGSDIDTDDGELVEEEIFDV